jgi:hypothetical protein
MTSSVGLSAVFGSILVLAALVTALARPRVSYFGIHSQRANASSWLQSQRVRPTPGLGGERGRFSVRRGSIAARLDRGF